MIKRLVSLLLILCMLAGFTAFAEDEESLLESQGAIDIEDDHQAGKSKESERVRYAKRRFKKEGFNVALKAPESLDGYEAIYTATMLKNATIRDKSDENDCVKSIQIPEGKQILIYDVQPEWVLTEYKDNIGWIKRIMLDDSTIKPINNKTIPPYGVTKIRYIANLSENCFVLNKPDLKSTPFKIPVDKGAKIAVIAFENGFAKVNIWRNYGYIDARLLQNVRMVSPSDNPLTADMPIAAYCSFFEHSLGKQSNDSRVVNINVSCKYMSMTLKPGEIFNFNNQVGPFKRNKGYQAAPVLINGGSQLGYGGGTCQSSSTLYNVLRQLPDIKILWRRPHGPGSAKYLPQHMDAAVGNSDLNLIFRNDYPFAIRFEAESVNGCVFVAAYKVQDNIKATK